MDHDPTAAAQNSKAVSGRLRNWLLQPFGPWHVLSVAWPLILSTGLFSLTIFVDRMFLYMWSDQAAASAMTSGTTFWAVTCVPVAIFGYTSTFVAQYVGVKRLDRAMDSVVQGLFLALLFSPIIFAIAWYSPYYFSLMHVGDLVKTESQYFQWVSVGGWATIVSAPLVGLFAGTNRTRVLLLCDAFVTVLNAVLDVVLIFGLLGLPALGVIGAGLATSASLVVKLLILFWAAYAMRWSDAENRALNLFSIRWRWNADLMRRLVRFGWPAGISTLAEAVTFSTIMMIVGQLGEQAMAATTLALGVNMIAFIPMMGLGMSVGVLVGQELTAGRIDLAERSVRSGLQIATIYSGCFAILYGFFPYQVLSIYGLGTDPARFVEMESIVVPILWFVAVYCIIDALQIVFQGALKGAGDTGYVLLGNALSGVITIGGGKLLADQLGTGGLYWWWSVMTAWVFLMAIAFSTRYFQGGWKQKRVIESNDELIADAISR